MQNVEIKSTEIKKKLSLLPGDKLEEVEDFVLTNTWRMLWYL